MESTEVSTYELTIRDERKEPSSFDRRVRIALKRMLRGLGLRCVEIKPKEGEDDNK